MGDPVRSKIRSAVAMIAALMHMPPQPGKPYGDAAKDLDLETAARFASRYKRRMFSTQRSMGPAELQSWGRKRRRARQTHPGKRGKRARP